MPVQGGEFAVTSDVDGEPCVAFDGCAVAVVEVDVVETESFDSQVGQRLSKAVGYQRNDAPQDVTVTLPSRVFISHRPDSKGKLFCSAGSDDVVDVFTVVSEVGAQVSFAGSSGFRVRDAVSDCRVLVMNEGRALGEDRSSSTRLSPKALSCNLPFLPRRVPSLMSFAALSSSASTSPALTSPMMTSLSSKPHYENLLGTAPSAVLKAGCVTT